MADSKEDIDQIIKENGSKNLGFHTHRLNFDNSDLENAFSEKWAKENKPDRALNYGGGILQDLFYRPEAAGFKLFTPKRALEITNRDRMVAATVVQWLGSNVGFCFLEECLKKAGYSIKYKKP